MINKVNLTDMTFEELEQWVMSIGAPKFRAKQIFGWIYKGKTDFREMKNLPEVFQNQLSEMAILEKLALERVQRSKEDGTAKYLFGLRDGNLIESVLMKYKYGNSLCVSSQAGCRMGCSFCASTKAGLARNLTPGEIAGQILAAEGESGEKINHIVVMGTGEPFDNYVNLSRFIRIINHREGLNIGMRNITVSTCGLVPKIDEFGRDFPQVNLAISLHGTTDAIRGSMMPINDRYPIAELMQACKRYVDSTNRRITLEYTLVAGVNDGREDRERLTALLAGMLCHVNLIPLNKVEESGLSTVSRQKAYEFRDFLASKGVAATVRREMGADIDGACGQLRLSGIRK